MGYIYLSNRLQYIVKNRIRRFVNIYTILISLRQTNSLVHRFQARPFFGVNREEPRMGNKVGDTFLDLYTFTAHSNEVGDTFYDLYIYFHGSFQWMGEIFLAEWLFNMGYLVFSQVQATLGPGNRDQVRVK